MKKMKTLNELFNYLIQNTELFDIDFLPDCYENIDIIRCFTDAGTYDFQKEYILDKEIYEFKIFDVTDYENIKKTRMNTETLIKNLRLR